MVSVKKQEKETYGSIDTILEQPPFFLEVFLIMNDLKVGNNKKTFLLGTRTLLYLRIMKPRLQPTPASPIRLTNWQKYLQFKLKFKQ
jgi:hypothetical protein